MSFDFQPLNESPVEFQTPRRPILGPISRWIFALALLGTVLLVAWAPARRAIKQSWARDYTKQALAAMKADDFGSAMSQLREAQALAPEEPEVLRACIEYLKLAQGHPQEFVYYFKLLSSHAALTHEEQILHASCLVKTGRIEPAKAIHAALPADVAQTPRALELLASLQAAEGSLADSAATTRQARHLDKESPQSVLDTAIENSRAVFPELRDKARAELLALSESPSVTGIGAVQALLRDPLLTLPQATRLLEIIESHPHASQGVRLEVVSALIRLQPDQRARLIDAEVQRFQAGKEGNLQVLSAWLGDLQEHARLVQIIPADLAASTPSLYSDLIRSLVIEGRWAEIKDTITRRKPPVSRTRAMLWLADAESHLQPDLKESRRLLTIAIGSATSGRELGELELACQLAQRLGMRELALQARLELARLDESRRLKMLAEAHSLATQLRDTRALLDISRSLQESNPSNPAYNSELAYLRLLLGQEMESVNLDGLTSPSVRKNVGVILPVELVQALAAYRFGDHKALNSDIAAVSLDGVPPGPRAVLSGLLATAGDAARAFQIAEKVPETLLLDEERAFLKLAK